MKRFSELERKYVLEVLDNEFHTSKNSIFTNKLEKKFAEVFNSNFAISLANGTLTLHAALVAIGVGPGDEVIVPPLTMSSPAISVLLTGATPIFADVDIETFNICPKSIEGLVTDKTKAVMPVALYGLSPDYDPILEICKKNKLYLIEDNAECFLGEYKGRLVGEFGDFASFSFQASKHMTCGEGGILLCKDEVLADKVRKFTSLGYAGVSSKTAKITRSDIQDPRYIRHVSLGNNYRMSELCSAVALGQLERLEELVEARIKSAKIINEVIASSNILIPQKEPSGYKNSYWACAAYLNSDIPERDWFRFKELYQANKGDGYYAAWKLSYHETLLINYQNLSWQKYDSPICPNAEFLQPRMLQFKTDYWNIEECYQEAKVIEKTIKQYMAL